MNCLDYEKLLREEGATEIEQYSLINNWGYTYVKNDIKYDSRFIANCYGAVCNWWETYSEDKEGQDKEFMKCITDKLNKLYRGEK